MAKRELKQKDVEETTVVTDEQVAEVVKETPVDESVMPMLEGVVTGCARLNIRKKASVKSDVVYIVDAKTKLTILESDNTKWFKVCVKPGVEGYCMKEYVNVEQ